MRCGSSTASSRAGCAFPSGARFPREAHFRGIGEDVLLLAAAQDRLLRFPEFRVEQIAVILVEDLARAWFRNQEAVELLGKNVRVADAPVGLGGKLFLVAARRR